MTPEQAAAGLVELVLPDGGRVFVDFRDELMSHPDIEAEVVQTLLGAEGSDRDICEAVAAYALASGLTARFFLGRESLIVAIGDATTGNADGRNGRRRYGSDIPKPRRVSSAASIRT